MPSCKTKLKGLDLFAGLGGSSWGATCAGVDIIAAVDRWELARDTYRSNFPNVEFLLERCEDIDLDQLKKKLGPIDLMIASPECTSHTCAKGNAPRSETSRRTAFQVVRFARAFKPRWLVVENVVHMRTWKSYSNWLRQLVDLGYNVKEQVVNAADHGVPQARRRLFVMCDRERPASEVQRTAKRRRTAASVVKKKGSFRFSDLRHENRAEATIERAERALAKNRTQKALSLGLLRIGCCRRLATAQCSPSYSDNAGPLCVRTSKGEGPRNANAASTRNKGGDGLSERLPFGAWDPA